MPEEDELRIEPGCQAYGSPDDILLIDAGMVIGGGTRQICSAIDKFVGYGEAEMEV